MKLTYAGITLVDDAAAIAPGAGWQFVMQQLVGAVQGVGRASGTPTARGNRQRPFGGSALRTFDTHAEALLFWGTHEASLPNTGTLVVSEGGTPLLTWSGAVLESVSVPLPPGLSVVANYTFRLPAAATT